MKWYIKDGRFGCNEEVDATVFEADETATEIVIPDGVTEICYGAFQNCSGLTNIIIPDSVTKIGWNAFNGCAGLKSITIPTGVTEIGGATFKGCTSLTSIIIPEGITSIEWQAFCYCSKLASVTIPESLTFVRNDAFLLTNVRHLYIKAWRNTGYTKWPDDMLIHTDDPMAVPIKRRVWAAVAFCEDGRSFNDEIGQAYAKYLKTNAAKIASVAMQQPALLQAMLREKLISAKDIDAYHAAAREKGDTENVAQLLAYQTDTLTTAKVVKTRARKAAELEDKQEQVADRAIARANKKDLAGLVFVLAGELETFQERNVLKALLESYGAKLASVVTEKTDYLVANALSSDSEKINKAMELGVDVIDEKRLNEMLYRRFTDAVEVVIPEWVRVIHSAAFRDCKNLVSITIPEGIKSIEQNAFAGCSSLEHIALPASIISIFWWAFEGCSSLKEIVIPDGVKNIGGWVFNGCSSLAEVTLPASLLMIGNSAFAGCESLTSIAIPEGVTTIDQMAFKNCTKLKSITLPASVTEIAHNAFQGCKGRTIYAPAGSYAEAFAKKKKIPFVAM